MVVDADVEVASGSNPCPSRFTTHLESDPQRRKRPKLPTEVVRAPG